MGFPPPERGRLGGGRFSESRRFSRTPEKTQRARRLRRDVTDAEKKLWLHLRGGQVSEVSFRRQHSIGTYFVDFCAPSLRLVIELDGGQHAESSADALRTSQLNDLGFYVLRFWNSDVMSNIDGVLQKIAEVITTRKTTPP
ncbi:MAG: DUF559 domain-containing protein [Rhodospirillaceae bacterium]|nr:DUF559 domain-containing protein [Rhodospirillaceae bacterium]